MCLKEARYGVYVLRFYVHVVMVGLGVHAKFRDGSAVLGLDDDALVERGNGGLVWREIVHCVCDKPCGAIARFDVTIVAARYS